MSKYFTQHLVENLTPFWHQRLGQMAPNTMPYRNPSHYPDAFGPSTSCYDDLPTPYTGYANETA